MRLIPHSAAIILLGAHAVGATPRAVDYRLDATFTPYKAYMSGIATIRVSESTGQSDSAHFLLHGELNVDSMRVDNRNVEFNQASIFYGHDYSLIASRVAFLAPIDSSYTVTVFYDGYFHASNARSPSDYMRIDQGGVLLRAYGYSLWFPIFLEPGADPYVSDFSDVTIRTPENYRTVFVGEKLAEDAIGGQRVSRWRASQVDLYEPQCTAREFEVRSESGFNLYYTRDSASAAMASNILDFVRKLKSAYGAKYRQAAASGQTYVMEMPQYGDISSGNVTGITSGIWLEFQTNEWSRRGLAHELVHPFVQTGTSQSDSLYSFAIEGFPSYFHLPVLADLFGEKWYLETMKQTEEEYLKKRKTGLGWRDRPLPKEKPLTAIGPSELSRYKDVFVLDDRALLLLHWLYRQLGRETFFAFSRELFNGGTVTNASFRKAILRHLPKAGPDLSLWLDTTEFPDKFRIP